ncbi:hypothetical protein ACK280_27935, partial [Mycobacterium sherrisii]
SFDVTTSSIPSKVFDYLSSLEWIRAQQNLAIVGPAGMLRVTPDDDVGVIDVDDDLDVRTAPLGVVSGAVVGVV